MRKRLAIAGGSILLLVAAFVAGRYSAPVKVEERVKVETKTETKTEWKDRIVYVEAKRSKVRTEETRKPTGEVVIVKTEETETDTRQAREFAGLSLGNFSTQLDQSKVTETARPGWRVGVTAGWSDLSLKPDLYGLELSRRVAGTVWAGLWARTDRTGGISLALEF